MTVSLATLLAEDRAADRPVALHDGQTIGLHRIRADVAAAAQRLRTMNCRRAAVACTDAYWAVVGWFALANQGGEAVLLPNTLPATLVSMAGSFDCIVSDGTVHCHERLVTLRPSDQDAPPLPIIDADKAIVSLFTSGSSGTPKRIVKTMRQLELEAEALEQLLGPTVATGARVHATVAHQHLYGLTFRLCWPLASGRVFVSHAEEFWEPLMATLRAGDVLITSPSHLSRLGGLPSLPMESRPSAVISGGAPLSQHAADVARGILGCPVREFFGSTEAGVVGSRVRAADAPAWQPVPNVIVNRLADGRLNVRSPFVSDPEGETTEDLVEFDKGGFQLRGRVDRIAKIEGVRVSLTEFETRIGSLAGIAQVAVVVLDGNNPQLGAVVVLDLAGQHELQAVGAFRLGRRLRHDLAQTLPAAALPRRWRFVRQLPAGPIGKSSAGDLAALFEAS